jgi:hypothetical protein
MKKIWLLVGLSAIIIIVVVFRMWGNIPTSSKMMMALFIILGILSLGFIALAKKLGLGGSWND